MTEREFIIHLYTALKQEKRGAKPDMNLTDKIVEYLKEGSQDVANFINGTTFKKVDEKDFGCFECFNKRLEKIFKTNLPCDKYDSVINGEGNEKEKISTVYSSSLQSFMVFANVSSKNPITIDKITYDNAFFEYKNKVIGYPSSIDVVLTNQSGNILFIESKLFEIVRDSSETGRRVAGPSYFSDDESGYYKRLDLELKELQELGFCYEGQGYGKVSGTSIKSQIQENDKRIRIAKLQGKTYVYSDGIKQTLAHIIGILNWKQGKRGANCSDYLNPNDYDQVRYLVLYNNLPGFSAEGAEQKQKDFVIHQNVLFDVLKKKGKVKEVFKEKKGISMSIKTYQEIYQKNREKYFADNKKMNRIVDFYRLKGNEQA